MHSPEVVVFDLHLPIPTFRRRWSGEPEKRRWKASLRRYTGGDHEGDLVYPRWRPAAWRVIAAGRDVNLYDLGVVWHNEPRDADSGTLCKGMGGSELTWHNVRWAWQHRTHCEIQVHALQNINRWLNVRCAACGKRLGYREAGTGYMGDDRTWHANCMNLEILRRQKEVLLRWIDGERDTSTRIQVEAMREVQGE